MKYLLAIATSPILLEENKAYWCAIKKFSTSPGDVVFVYVKGKGVSQLFYVSDNKDKKIMINCELRAMDTIWLKHIINLSNSLNSKMMKGNLLLSKLEAVRRNFQGTTFLLSADDASLILKELVSLNPNNKKELEMINILSVTIP